MADEALRSCLIGDLQTLAQEARRPDSLTGQLTGWISGPEHPLVRGACEKSLARLTSDSWREHIADTQACLRPFLVACESRSPKLANFSLLCLHRLQTQHCLGERGLPLVIKALEQSERINDEGVKLKSLQTSLTLMQLPELVQKEEGVAAVLGVCFRILADTKNSDSVLSTAIATVRQAVTLVFEHVSFSMDAMSSAGPREQSETNGLKLDGDQADVVSSPVLARHGAANAALKLLDDLCMMATANEAMLKWLRAPSLPRVFVLDLLEFVLSNTAPVFRNIAAFEHALSVRVCGLLITMLQNLVDPRCERSLQENEMRVVLRVVRTVITNFHSQLRSKCGIFVEALLAGASPECSSWQQMNVMLVLRQLMSSPVIVHFLFVTYDLKQDPNLNAVTQIISTMSQIVDAHVVRSKEQNSTEAMYSISHMYQQKVNAGKDWPMEADMSQLSGEARSALLCTLAIDGLTAFALSLHSLTQSRALEKGHISETSLPEQVTCIKLVEATWRKILPTISRLLGGTASDVLVAQLLQAYAALTKAAGELELTSAQNSFLASLCEFTVLSHEQTQQEMLPSPTSSSGKGDLVKRNSSNGLLTANEGSHILSSKNVQAFKTLFEIARYLDHHLGRSWVLVLENLNSLDRILHQPRTISQEASATQNQNLSSDLATLQHLADQLFQHTATMSTKACTDVLLSLRAVSSKCLAGDIPQNPGLPRLYALGRMVEVLLANLLRLHDLWPIFLEHIVEALGDARAPFRGATLDCLNKAVGGALASVVTFAAVERRSPRISNNTGNSEKEEEERTSAGAAEHMIIAALVELYADSREIDVQLGLLRIVLQALQRHGEQLSSGWEMVLKLLEGVAPTGEAASVSLAFQSFQLVAADFMPNLPASLLQNTIHLAASYASQQADMNVGLAAINVLWNSADLLTKRSVHSQRKANGLANGHAEASAQTHSDELLDAEQFDELIRSLFKAIQKLSMDPRPEIRNSAVRTLFLVITSQGSRLPQTTWEETVWQIVFPLIRAVHHRAATSSREESETEILGKLKGRDVPMVMHHSRNSQQKAWDETLVLALAGMGKLLKAHFSSIAVMPDFSQGWEELMMILESSMAGGRKEVAVAAMQLLVTVTQAHGDSQLMQRVMWKRALRATGVGVEAAASPQCMVPLQARLELVSTISQLHASLKKVADPEDLHDMFCWLESLVKNPFSQDDCSPPLPGTLPPVQKNALHAFPQLAPLDHESLWPDFLSCLLRLLRPARLQPQSEEQVEAGMQPSARDLMRWANTSLLMETVIHVLVHLFSEEMPWQQRAANLGMCLDGLAECSMTRYTAFSENLWRVAVSALNAIIAIGLPAVNIAYVNHDKPPDSHVWTALLRALQCFLLGRDAEEDEGEGVDGESADLPDPSEDSALIKAVRPLESDDLSSEESLRDADLEASVLDTLTDTVLTACSWCPTDIQHKLVAVVEQGVGRPAQMNLPGSADGARFPQLCLRKLYVICSRGGTSDGPDSCLHQIAKQALPLLLERARIMLEEHAEACNSVPNRRWSGQSDALHLDTFQCMLEVLLALTVTSAVTDAAIPAGHRLKELLELQRQKGGSRPDNQEQYHLMILYQPLLACVVSDIFQVRRLVHDLLHNVGVALQLSSA